MSEKIIRINPLEKEALTDTMRNCTEEAAKALSEMINRKVEITSTTAEIMRINDISKHMNPNDVTTTVLFTKLSGSLKCIIVISSTLKDILKMADMFLHKKAGYFKDLSEANISAIKEFANIITGYYISALNAALNVRYKSITPTLSMNPRRAIEEFDFGSIYTEEINVLILDANIQIPADEINEKIIIVFKANDLKRIINRIIR